MRKSNGSEIGYSRAPYSSTVNTMLGSSEKPVLFYQCARRHIPKKRSLNTIVTSVMA